MNEVKYAIYPGSVDTVDEEGNPTGTIVWTALELATAYGVQGEPYRTVLPTDLEMPALEYMQYIHLKPRKDNRYINMKTQVEAVWREDFDGTKRWTDETDPLNIDPDITEDMDESNSDFQ